MDLEKAKRILEAAEAEAKNLGRGFSIVVLDAGGHVVALHRMEGAHFLTPQIAQGKAYGCAAFGRSGPELAQMGERNPSFVGALVEITGGKFVAAQGACPIKIDGKLIGAVGASGATPEQDQQVAEAGAKAVA